DGQKRIKSRSHSSPVTLQLEDVGVGVSDTPRELPCGYPLNVEHPFLSVVKGRPRGNEFKPNISLNVCSNRELHTSMVTEVNHSSRRI
ncbi:MAG: hypothetical protein ACK5PF_11030, partial [bacterium]